MRPSYQVYIIDIVKLRRDLVAEKPTRTPRRHGKQLDFLWVAPHEVTHGPLVWHLLLSIDRLDLVQRVYVGAQSTMHAKDLLVDDGRQGQKVHNFSAIAPYIDRAVLAKALIIEPIDLCDLP